MQAETNPPHQWLRAGNEIFPALLAAVDAAQKSICLEIYIYTPGPLANRFRDALVQARARGVRVRVLVDAVGSLRLPGDYWLSLRAAGGEVRQFNPLTLKRFWIRNHRKLLICDDQVAFVGGFNIAPEYEGNGIDKGWWDLGLKLAGNLVPKLADSFEEMFGRAEFKHKHFVRLRQSGSKKIVACADQQLLINGPGRGPNTFKRALQQDLARAKQVQIMVAYFLPPRRLRRNLLRVVRRGGRVQLLLGGKTDVALSQLAAQSLYRRFLKEKVEIHEYQPQILHAKLMIVDDVVYIGSSNLDPRSLLINYELMVRFDHRQMAAEARQIFADSLRQSRPVTAADWLKARTFFSRLKQRWAHFLLSRVDPYFAHCQWRSLPR